MTEKATLYFAKTSPPARAALLGLRYLNVDVEIKHINLLERDQKTEEYLKLNPVGKVPVFVDADGFTLTESRAILAYLVNTRKPGSDLYANDAKKRALIDQRLYFDATILFPTLRGIVRPVIYYGATSVDQAAIEEAKDVIKLLDGFLSDSEYFAGDKLTLADISILATITSLAEFKFDFTDFPKLAAWYRKMQSVPGFDENLEGARFIANFVNQKIGNVFK